MASFLVDGRPFSVDTTVAETEGASSFTVASGGGAYAVECLATEPGPEEVLGDLLGRLGAPVVVADGRVLALHLRGGLGPVPCLAVEASEATKSLEGAAAILDFLVEQKVGRGSTVVAIGGGVVQDVTGFACGILKRGVAWTYLPTTLLAQADSCIGSKTGINYRRTKNLLGLFGAPRRVVSHPGFLATLSEDDLRSGLGEIFKLCVTGGDECLSRFEADLDSALAGDLSVLRRLAALALSVKRPVIEADERDLGERRALNFGHSVGHAIEAATGYEVPHGIAVTVGALVECELSRARARLSEHELARIVPTAVALLPGELGRRLAELEVGPLMDLLGRDKKVEGTILKLAVPVGLGAIELLDLRLDSSGLAELETAFARVLSLL